IIPESFHLDLNIGEEERHDEEEEEDELYRDVNINQGRGLQGTLEVEDIHVTLTLVKPNGQQESSSVSSQFVTSMLNLTIDVGMESIFETTSRTDVQTPTFVAPLPMTIPTMASSTIATTIITSQAPILPIPIPSEVLQNLPNFTSVFCFDDKLRSLEENFFKFRQTNQFAGAKIIKEQVKEQVKAQVSKILPRIEQAVNEQLEAKVLTRSSHSSRTSYAVAANLSEMELKKILIEKIKGNKSIQRSDEQSNLYKALVDAYESNKIILDTYGESVTLKRRRDDDEDKDKEPSAGPVRGSKRRREEEPMQTTSQIEEPSHPEFETGADDQPIVQSSKHPEWFSQPQKPPSPDRDWNKTLPAVYGSIQLVDTLTPELLAGPTYDLVQGSCKSIIELEYHLEEVYKATTDQLDWVNPEGQQYPHNLLQPLLLIPDNRGHRVIPFAHFINNDLEYLRGATYGRPSTGCRKLPEEA
nr:hypothetical protein [Tanacetum cinerariifolium]